MDAGELAIRSLPETIGLLSRPFALEDIGTQAVPLVVTHIDAGDVAATTDDERTRLHDNLAAVRAVSVAVLDTPADHRVAEVAEGFDIVVGPPGGGTGVVDLAPPAAIQPLAEAGA